MKRNENGLPLFCFVTVPGTEDKAMIMRGESGYYPCQLPIPTVTLNEQMGVTEKEAEAMLAGSMFGWDVPAALACKADHEEKEMYRKFTKQNTNAWNDTVSVDDDAEVAPGDFGAWIKIWLYVKEDSIAS